MSNECNPGMRARNSRFGTKKPEQHLRLMRHEGMPVVRQDEGGELRYVYDNGTIDPRSTVDHRLPNIDHAEYVELHPEIEQDQMAETAAKLGETTLIASAT